MWYPMDSSSGNNSWRNAGVTSCNPMSVGGFELNRDDNSAIRRAGWAGPNQILYVQSVKVELIWFVSIVGRMLWVEVEEDDFDDPLLAGAHVDCRGRFMDFLWMALLVGRSVSSSSELTRSIASFRLLLLELVLAPPNAALHVDGASVRFRLESDCNNVRGAFLTCRTSISHSSSSVPTVRLVIPSEVDLERAADEYKEAVCPSSSMSRAGLESFSCCCCWLCSQRSRLSRRISSMLKQSSNCILEGCTPRITSSGFWWLKEKKLLVGIVGILLTWWCWLGKAPQIG